MDDNDESTTSEPDYQFYVSYDFYKKDNPHFHRSKLYGFHQGEPLTTNRSRTNPITDCSRIVSDLRNISSKKYEASSHPAIESYLDVVTVYTFTASKRHRRRESIL